MLALNKKMEIGNCGNPFKFTKAINSKTTKQLLIPNSGESIAFIAGQFRWPQSQYLPQTTQCAQKHTARIIVH